MAPALKAAMNTPTSPLSLKHLLEPGPAPVKPPTVEGTAHEPEPEVITPTEVLPPEGERQQQRVASIRLAPDDRERVERIKVSTMKHISRTFVKTEGTLRSDVQEALAAALRDLADELENA